MSKPSPTLDALFDRAFTVDGRKKGWIADKAGIDASTLSLVLKGARPPRDLGKLHKLVTACGGTNADYAAVCRELAAFDLTSSAPTE